MRFERIVLGTDFSAAARAALEHAVAIAARFEARLYLIHAIDVRDGDGAHIAGNEHRADAFYELAEEQAREQLEALRQRIDAPAAVPDQIPIVESVRIGAPADEVLRFAAEKEADLIVVGTHGRTGLRRVLLGSTAESIVRQAPCPVLTVRVPEEEETRARSETARPASPPLETIVCAVDASESSRAALRAAIEIADRFDAKVVALSAVDDYVIAQAAGSPIDALTIETRLAEAARALLDRAIEEAPRARSGRAVERRVEVGRPAEVLVRVAVEERAQLVACGTHGRSGLSRALFGSIAEQIVRQAPCPVLTVREGTAAARAAA